MIIMCSFFLVSVLNVLLKSPKVVQNACQRTQLIRYLQLCLFPGQFYLYLFLGQFHLYRWLVSVTLVIIQITFQLFEIYTIASKVFSLGFDFILALADTIFALHSSEPPRWFPLRSQDVSLIAHNISVCHSRKASVYGTVLEALYIGCFGHLWVRIKLN